MPKQFKYTQLFLSVALVFSGFYLLVMCTNSCSLPRHLAVQDTMDRLEAEQHPMEYAPVTKCVDHEVYEIDQRDGSSMPKIYIVGAC